jgi:hypothetical protein
MWYVEDGRELFRYRCGGEHICGIVILLFGQTWGYVHTVSATLSLICNACLFKSYICMEMLECIQCDFQCSVGLALCVSCVEYMLCVFWILSHCPYGLDMFFKSTSCLSVMPLWAFTAFYLYTPLKLYVSCLFLLTSDVCYCVGSFDCCFYVNILK